MTSEKWIDIKEISNLYQISNLGRVRNNPKKVKNKQCYYTTKQHILAKTPNEKGYERVRLTDGINKKTFRVHRLVAKYFVNNPENFKEVNHKDFNKKNNNFENLEWCSRMYNMRHYFNSINN